MSNTCDVTVILPVYNVGPYIEQTLKSIVDQTRPPREIIVVDDASTDDTVSRIRAFDIPQLVLLESEENRGPWFARNRALEAASSTWVSLIDGDDWFEPSRLERLLEHAKTFDADMVFDDMACWADGGSAPFRTALGIRDVKLDSPRELTPVEFVTWDLGVMKPLMRKPLLDEKQIRFNGNVRSGGDFSMFLKTILRGAKPVITPEPLYHYRFRAGQITADRTKLFTGTSIANEEAREEARAAQAHEVMHALDTRAERIRRQQTLNEVVQAIRGGRPGKALGLLARHPGAVRMATRKVLSVRRIAEKVRLRRL